jgi:hypothetical protein
MEKKHTVGKVIFGIILIISAIGWISEALTPRCKQSGCDKTPASGSEYCYLHKSSTGSQYRRSTGSSSSKSKSSTTSTGSTNKSTTTSTGSTSKSSTKSSSSSTSKSSSSKSSYSNSYDEGYEAIYDDDDYDIDRYNSDSDYADGVDDAMEDEDW